MTTGAAGTRPELPPRAAYEPPRVERVVTPADLDHEVMYAGPGIATADEFS